VHAGGLEHRIDALQRKARIGRWDRYHSMCVLNYAPGQWTGRNPLPGTQTCERPGPSAEKQQTRVKPLKMKIESSSTTHQHVQRKLKDVKVNTSHTLHSLHSYARDSNAYRAHRHGSESPYPGSTPGLNPCNHLAWLAYGPWRTHIQAWYGMAWYGMAFTVSWSNVI
jgi:hypothetical protein